MPPTKSHSWGLHLTSLLPVNIVQAVMAFVGLAIYSRLMSPEAYGEYVLAMTAQLLGQFIVFGWLSAGIPRFTAQCEAEGTNSKLLTTAYALFGLLALIFILAAAALFHAPFVPLDYQGLILATLASGILRSAALIGLEAHRSGLRITRYSLFETLQAVISVILGGYLVRRLGGRPEGIFIALGLVNLAIILLDYPWLSKVIKPGDFSRAMAKRLWQYGAPLMLSTLFCCALAYIDRFILAHLSDKEAVGMYGAALSLAERPMMMGFLWVASASSSLGFHTMEHGKEEDVSALMERALGTLIVLTFPMAVGLTVLAIPISSVLLGAEFHEKVADLLGLVALSAILKGLVDHYLSQFFQLSMRTGLLSLIYAFALALSLAANLLLVPRFGAVGTLSSALIAYGLALLSMVVIARRWFPVRFPWLETLKVLVACSLMYQAVQGLEVTNTPVGLVLGVGFGVGVYALAILALDIGQWRSRLFKPLFARGQRHA
jgi:O-antigen/teichoic acid export membrane protein